MVMKYCKDTHAAQRKNPYVWHNQDLIWYWYFFYIYISTG